MLIKMRLIFLLFMSLGLLQQQGVTAEENPITMRHEQKTSADNTMIPWKSDSRSLILKFRVIFSFTVNSIDPLFPIDDFPHDGYHPWHLKGTILKIYKGTLGKAQGSSFETQPLIYIGPILSRPGGIWVSSNVADIPHQGESWAIFCNPKDEKASPEDLLQDQGKGCSAYRLKEVKEDLELAEKISALQLALDPAINLAKEHIKTTGDLFYSFLCETYGEAAVKDLGSLEKFLSSWNIPPWANLPGMSS
jgi:hypothetical protein